MIKMTGKKYRCRFTHVDDDDVRNIFKVIVENTDDADPEWAAGLSEKLAEYVDGIIDEACDCCERGDCDNCDERASEPCHNEGYD